jgi:phosphatidylserine decarboxylase
MDPFVVTSLGRKTLRTPVVRHNLNHVYNEKMVFQVMKHEQNFTIGFTVMDRDKFSGNDFVASAEFPLQTLVQAAPVANPETGLYKFLDPTGTDGSLTGPKPGGGTGISSSPPASSFSKFPRSGLVSRSSSGSLSAASQLERPTSTPPAIVLEGEGRNTLNAPAPKPAPTSVDGLETDGLKPYTIALTLRNKERWEDRHFP